MDWQSKIGFGLTLVFGFLQFTGIGRMPNWVTWPGISIGLLFFLWGCLPNHQKIPIGPAILFIVCVAGIAGSVAWYRVIKEPKALSIFLADCTFDGKFEVIGNFEAFRKAYPESGSATIIMNIFPKDMPNENINIKIAGNWQGTTGIMPMDAEDSVVFILSERMFVFYHIKPIIEYATNKMTHLYAGKEYIIQLNGSPGFAIPLFPKLLNIRSHEGIIFTIPNFAPLKERLGWYYAVFKLG